MKCEFCDSQTQMTVRDAKGNLHNCCKPCKDAANGKQMRLWVSCVWNESADKKVIDLKSKKAERREAKKRNYLLLNGGF